MTQLSCPAIHTSSAALDSAGCALGTARRHLAHPAMGLLREFCWKSDALLWYANPSYSDALTWPNQVPKKNLPI